MAMPYNPRSKKNLKPRELYYQEPKKRHEVTVTPEGWEGFQEMAATHGLSASELIERLGRGTLSLGDALGDEPQGDVLTVTEWAITTGKAVDAQGRRYRVMREKDA